MPLPIITEPFSRVAMDIVGPLPRSRSGNKYILVLCDYGTKYPEAIPLKSIDAEHIAEQLIGVFSRIGIPREILTDQGSNFTSQLLAELYRLLNIHPIVTSPYHPQTDGLVERFKKEGKSMRMCVDYRRLNSVTKVEAYPMPRVDELIDRLGKAKYITTLDLTRGYWQVPVAAKDRYKTAFITPWGLYEFKVMPFGLSGAPASFQKLMDRILRGSQEYSEAYLDDVVIFSETWEEHLKHLTDILERIRKAGLTVKLGKCQFAMSQCVYLGHVVGNGIEK